jgi:hypothetical protein
VGIGEWRESRPTDPAGQQQSADPKSTLDKRKHKIAYSQKKGQASLKLALMDYLLDGIANLFS